MKKTFHPPQDTERASKERVGGGCSRASKIRRRSIFFRNYFAHITVSVLEVQGTGASSGCSWVL